MIRDKALELDTAFSVAGQSHYRLPANIIDLQQENTLGGEELFMTFECTVVPTPFGATTPRFQFWAVMGNSANMTVDPFVLGSTQMFGAGAISPAVPQIGQIYQIPLSPVMPQAIEPLLAAGTARRYLACIFYNGTEDPTNHYYDAGTFKVHVVQGIQTARMAHFPAGFGVL